MAEDLWLMQLSGGNYYPEANIKYRKTTN